MTTTRYNKIMGIQTKFGSNIQSLYSDELVVVTEKIHGTNFSIYVKDNAIIYCRRSGPILVDEKFFNFSSIRERLNIKVSILAEHLKSEYYKVDSFQVYGELFGGIYPGISTGNPAIQKGIFYTPNIEFMVFDIKLNDEYMYFSDVISLSEKSGFNVVPILNAECSLKDALKIDISKISSAVPKMLGFDDLKNNIIEGVVIKSNKNKQIKGKNSRLILKFKNDAFLETKPRIKIKNKPSIYMDEQSIKTFEILSSYICDNRWFNLTSKEAPFTNKQFGKAVGLFIKDVFEDFYNDGNKLPIWDNSKKTTIQQNLIKTRLSNDIIGFVSKKIIN